MESIVSYLGRADLTPIKTLTEADCFIFTILSYVRFEKIIKSEEETITIGSLCRALVELRAKKKSKPAKEMGEIVSVLPKCHRYKNLRVVNLVALHDTKNQLQFAAVTVLLPNNSLFVSFRGTDDTILGWKEDLNFAFMETLPSQPLANEYFDKIAAKYPNRKIYLGGHSKGGNLAVYAAVRAEESVQDRIQYILDADSPGLREEVLSSPSYLRILPKIRSFIPEFDIIGLIFRKEGAVNVVASSAKGVAQHFQWTWLIEEDYLAVIRVLKSSEELDDGMFNELMAKLTPKQIENYLNTIYNLLIEEGTLVRLSDLSRLKKIRNISKRYSSLPKEEKKKVREISALVIREYMKQRKVGSKK